ncbi:MAG: hypothetical protein CBB97_24780 [Candidatus Endolissoclinum sp. TMED37]|nr:MAG: hypothetical protein CBB97_24780 [Candidatus Endolissoclinum sp. TMED37]|tara:strand:+ start:1045 stop:1731 length:687 start_codon:yes stop_codon:yes gene_type:complete
MSAMIDMRQILDVLNKQMEVIKEKDRQIAKLESLLKKKIEKKSDNKTDKKKQKDDTKLALIKEVISLYKKWFKESPSKDAKNTLSEYKITDLRKVISEYKRKIRQREKEQKTALASKKSETVSKREKTRNELQKQVKTLTGKETTETSIVKLRKLISEKTPKKEKKANKNNTKKAEIGKRELKKIELAKEYGKLTKKEKGWNIPEFVKNKTTAELRSLVKCQKMLNKK